MYKGLIIGRSAEIIESTDPSLKGRAGLVIDETKNTVVLRENTGRMIRVPKYIVKLTLASSNEIHEPVIISGSELLATPEERIKG